MIFQDNVDMEFVDFVRRKAEETAARTDPDIKKEEREEILAILFEMYQENEITADTYYISLSASESQYLSRSN